MGYNRHLFPNRQRYSDTAMPVTVHKHLESAAMFLFYTSEKQAAEYLVLFDNELSKVVRAN